MYIDILKQILVFFLLVSPEFDSDRNSVKIWNRLEHVFQLERLPSQFFWSDIISRTQTCGKK